MITGREIREARSLLKWTIPALSARSKVPEHVITRAESVDSTSSITLAQGEALQRTFEAAGVDFIPENGGGAGVRLRKRQED